MKTLVKTFPATLEQGGAPLQWVIARIPFDVAKVWGARGMLKVKGDINGFPFRTSLFPRPGGHILLVNKRMQAGTKAAPGAVAQFRLEPDTGKRTVTVPPELQRLLKQEPGLSRWFNALNYSMRKYIADWITDVKSAPARVRRSEQIAERLLETMEAERELPPLLQVAFAREPRAREGWERMSPTRRRACLMAVFYYRDPESRARRVAKVVEEAVQRAEKSSGPMRAA